jgi:hypothetical protein
MQQIIWMLCGFLLPDNHDNSSSSNHYPLSHNYTLPHDPTNDLPFACLPKTYGHQAESRKNCVQGDNWENMQ